jgi:hypothetical protein
MLFMVDKWEMFLQKLNKNEDTNSSVNMFFSLSLTIFEINKK